jgi:hypothetical protein
MDGTISRGETDENVMFDQTRKISSSDSHWYMAGHLKKHTQMKSDAGWLFHDFYDCLSIELLYHASRKNSRDCPLQTTIHISSCLQIRGGEMETLWSEGRYEFVGTCRLWVWGVTQKQPTETGLLGSPRPTGHATGPV